MEANGSQWRCGVRALPVARATRRGRAVRAECVGRAGAGAAEGEDDAVSAQKSGQLSPFIAVFPQGCMGQLAYFGPTASASLAQVFWAAIERP
jgi:hypothetical protein